MKNLYFIDTIRRRSRNNGINFCQYWVIKNINTDEIVFDGDFNINKKESKQKAEEICQALNEGRLKTRIFTRSNGTKGEVVVWSTLLLEGEFDRVVVNYADSENHTVKDGDVFENCVAKIYEYDSCRGVNWVAFVNGNKVAEHIERYEKIDKENALIITEIVEEA